MHAKKRKLKEGLKRSLKINTTQLESMLEESIVTTSTKIAKYGWSGKAYQIVEQQFDRLLLTRIQKKGFSTNQALIQHLRDRLDQRFLVPPPTNYIIHVYRDFQQSFLENLLAMEAAILKPDIGLVYRFQKLWDKKLLVYFQSEEVVKKEQVAAYYYQYLKNNSAVQWATKTFQTDLPNQSADFYETRLQETFTQFFTKIADVDFAFKENADAFFLTIYRSRIKDAIARQKRPIVQKEPSKPTNLEFDKAPEAAYLPIETYLTPYKAAYIPYLPKALEMIGHK